MVEGAPHRAKRSKRSIVVSMGCPLPPYIKEQGREAAGEEEGAAGGTPTPTGSRTPPFPCWSRRGKEGREEEKEKGGRRPPPLLVQFGLEG